jgi:two-component system response regulator FixJ
MVNETRPPPNSDTPVVYVVVVDDAVRESLSWLLRSAALDVEACASAEDFVDRYRPERPGCVVLDVRMPGMSGLQLQEKLGKTDIQVSIVMISGHGDIQTAVQAMKAGAIDFIEKPFNDQLLLDAVHKSVERDVAARRMQRREVSVRARYARLSPRERQVFDQLVRGSRNSGCRTRARYQPANRGSAPREGDGKDEGPHARPFGRDGPRAPRLDDRQERCLRGNPEFASSSLYARLDAVGVTDDATVVRRSVRRHCCPVKH